MHSVLKSMGGRGGFSKRSKIQRKQNAVIYSDGGIPIQEISALKNALLTLKQSLLRFNGTVIDSSAYPNPIASQQLHAGLGDVLNTLRTIVDKYPLLSTPEVYASVHMLVCYIQNYECHKISTSEADRLGNQLAFYFTKSVSQFIVQLGDSYEKSQPKSLNTEDKKAIDSSSSIFGVELEKYLDANKLELPFILTKCINEIEEHGLFVKGIYRVSAVKSKVNQLCEAFEKYGSNINLTDVNPNIIANVLKLYLRELPQPLFTFDLYPEFIRIAKQYATDLTDENTNRCVDNFRQVLIKLPKGYYTAVAAVIQHLQRISAQSDMNNMSAYNLAVIFGPTLLHCLRESSEGDSRAALLDSIHQIRAIELMVTCANVLFQED